jgi:DNA ligase (NAD+)
MNYLQKSKEFLEKDIEFFTIEDVKILQKLIEYHSDLYYNKENPIISDKEYDELFKKLEILEEKYKNKLDFFQTKKV